MMFGKQCMWVLVVLCNFSDGFILDCLYICYEGHSLPDVYFSSCGCINVRIQGQYTTKPPLTTTTTPLETTQTSVLAHADGSPLMSALTLNITTEAVLSTSTTTVSTTAPTRTTMSMCDYLCAIQEGGAACSCSKPIVPGK
ncbi:hypothetical protein DPMN_074503 [Dreissena polymorpha]|uniref:Uncharacterized protein n=1 Tax=Dreissena polymorpha TaxID=45954 RepID=A0A9D3YIL2_DREPO|nr:hypothetical protein DPMN_074503 [Dreissena polymorpha]